MDAQIVTMSGSVPRGVRKDIYRELVEKVKGWGKKVILDTSGELLREGIEAKPDMIKPNQEELSLFFGRPMDSLEDVKSAARELCGLGIENVVVSLGKEGAVLACSHGVFYGKPPVIQAVNTVGCGDSMVAALAVSFCRGYTPEESLRYAVAVSAANALSLRTGYFETEKMKHIYPGVTMRDVSEPD